MSKIYKNGESVKVCTNCGDWSEEDNEWDTYETVVFNKDNYTKKDVYDGNRSYIYIDDDDTWTTTVYMCPSCECWFEDEPDAVPIWLCGTCNEKFVDEYLALECC